MEGTLDLERPVSRPSGGPHPEWLCEMCKVAIPADYDDNDDDGHLLNNQIHPFTDEAVALLG